MSALVLAATLCCDSCKEAVASAQPALAEGFGWSILFLLGAVLVVVPGAFTLAVVRRVVHDAPAVGRREPWGGGR